jgi:hypothetical protein
LERESQTEITTLCHGYVASAATVIAQAASAGRRQISSSALYLIHNATTQIEGNRQEVERTARLLSKTDERIAEIYATRSGRPTEAFTTLMARGGGHGEWLSPDEALAERLVDKINQASALAAVRRTVHQVRNLFSRPEREQPLPAVFELEELRALQERVRRLESENAQLQARPSTTLPKEYPGILAPNLLNDRDRHQLEGGSGNRSAYEGDARSLFTSY